MTLKREPEKQRRRKNILDCDTVSTHHPSPFLPDRSWVYSVRMVEHRSVTGDGKGLGWTSPSRLSTRSRPSVVTVPPPETARGNVLVRVVASKFVVYLHG